jgi:S1-C subfamily serine protease
MRTIVLPIIASLAAAGLAAAQAPGVPVYDELKLKKADAGAKKAAVELQKAGSLLGAAAVKVQMEKKQSCVLDLPAPHTEKLAPRDLWKRARAAHLRIGWLFKDSDKPNWQITLSGGYVISADGAVATCYHVVEPGGPEMKDAVLIAATDDDKVLPVTEILAASHDTDTCILRVKSDEKLTALPLSLDVMPGDPVYCFSEPAGRRGFFSASIVNRFVQRPVARLRKKDPVPEKLPTYLEVGADWAPGSSGAAVLDERGNAVGHVATVESIVDDQSDLPKKQRSFIPGTVIVFHGALSAQHVKDLVKSK